MRLAATNNCPGFALAQAAFLFDRPRAIGDNFRSFGPRDRRSGRLAQLGERRVRNAEAEGSNPLPSTKPLNYVAIPRKTNESLITAAERQGENPL